MSVLQIEKLFSRWILSVVVWKRWVEESDQKLKKSLTSFSLVLWAMFLTWGKLLTRGEQFRKF